MSKLVLILFRSIFRYNFIFIGFYVDFFRFSFFYLFSSSSSFGFSASLSYNRNIPHFETDYL